MKFHLIILINLIIILPALAAEYPYVQAVSSYCTQYNSTELYLDKSLIEQLTNKQYLLEDFETNIPNEGARLDYFIKYFHIAKGFCYYNTEEDVKKSLDSIKEITTIVDDKVDVKAMQYSKTVNCYYMYRQYLYKDSEQNYDIKQNDDGSTVKELKIKQPCKTHYIKFYNTMLYFLNNSTLCPYPQDKRMISLGDEDTIKEARNQYIYELQEYFNEITNENCYDELNEEIINCGFNNKEGKTDYCHIWEDECCNYRSQIENIKLIDYKPKTTAIIIGSSTSFVFLILGMFFSYDAIKDIKTKEKIEEAVYRQERMYKNKQQSRRNSGYSSDNQSSLHPPSHHAYSLPKSQVQENRPIRSPQPLPASPANYSNYNSNASLLGGNSNVGNSSNSVNLRPRVSSLYSQSSADISSDISVPIEVPVSPYLDRPYAERRSSSLVDYPTDRPASIVERPPRTTPVLDCPKTPNLQSPGSPYLQPGNHSNSRPNTPSTPSRISSKNPHTGSRPTTPNLHSPNSSSSHPGSRPTTPKVPRPPRTPENEHSNVPKLELPPSSPFLYLN